MDKRDVLDAVEVLYGGSEKPCMELEEIETVDELVEYIMGEFHLGIVGDAEGTVSMFVEVMTVQDYSMREKMGIKEQEEEVLETIKVDLKERIQGVMYWFVIETAIREGWMDYGFNKYTSYLTTKGKIIVSVFEEWLKDFTK